MGTKEFILSEVTSIESVLGVTTMVGSSGDDLRMELKDSKIFGEAIELLEPTCKTTSGIMIALAAEGGKPVHITMPSGLPMYKP